MKSGDPRQTGRQENWRKKAMTYGKPKKKKGGGAGGISITVQGRLREERPDVLIDEEPKTLKFAPGNAVFPSGSGGAVCRKRTKSEQHYEKILKRSEEEAERRAIARREEN